MHLSDYTMARETPSKRTYTHRELFEHQGRILGTEIVIEEHFEGSDRGWVRTERTTDTRHFWTRDEGAKWIDELHEFDQVQAVKEAGGTKLVFIL